MKTQTSVYRFGRLLTTIGLVMAPVLCALADYHATVLADHPIAYWPINSSIDPSSPTATDLSGNGNNGAYVSNDPEFNTVTGPTAYIPTALAFDGFSSYVDLSGIPNPGLLNFGGTITMEAWVQAANTSEGPADILTKGYDSSQNYNEVCLRANGGSYYGGSFNFTNGSGSVSGGQQTTSWSYVVATYDGTNWNIYQNAVLKNHSGSAWGSIQFSDNWNIGVGSADAGPTASGPRWFNGNLTEVAMYTNALTPAQILTHFYSAEVNSAPATSAPIIIAQPQTQSGFVGGSVTFSAAAVSSPAMTNQWYFGSNILTNQTNSSLVLNNLQLTNAGNYHVIFGNANGSTNSVTVSLSVATGSSIVWSASGNNGNWDTATSANWTNKTTTVQTVFNTGDAVLFDDTVGVPTTVNVSGTVSPSITTVNSSTNNYTFSGSGSISGSGGLVKDGASTLTIVNPDNFTGPVTIKGGTIYAGDFAFNSASSITVTNGGTLDFGGSTYDNNQTLTISGAGVSGHGAVYNTVFNPGQLYNIVLAGDATIGCTPGNIWGLNNGSVISGPHKLTIKWGNSGDYTEWNGVSFAANSGDFELASGKLGIKNMGSNFGPASSTFTVDAGTELDFWTSDFGYAKNYHVFGTYQILAGFTTLNASYTLENGCQFTGIFGGGNQTITGTFALNGTAHLVLGDGNFIFTNVISGPGGFVWDAYNHALVLQSSNTYTGPTVIGGGSQILTLTGNGSISHSSLIFFGGNPGNETNTAIDVTGRPDQTLTLVSGQTLGGIGRINGSLVVSNGATIAPAGTNTTISITTGANPTGILLASANVTLLGTTTMKLNGSGVNDQIQAGASLTYGGTLNLVNISGASYAAGNSFQIFSAASYHGSFGSISPATPGAGLAWDTSQLNIGFINVIASGGAGPLITNPKVAGGNFIFTGTGGTANNNYVVYTSTNLASGVWTPLITNTFDSSGNFGVTNAISTTTPKMFYRIK